MQFPEDTRQRFLGNVHDGIEGRDPSQHFIQKAQSQHVSFEEGNAGIQPSRLFQHAGREIQAEDGGARIAQIAGDVTRAATHIADFAAASRFGGEAIEQFAVERLVLEFVENATRILRRKPIVAFANRVGR